ncbi:MAG TPA: clostripain-related cysteine peptidase [Bacteroidales bacterium]|nr:clostripain-related cysteine peptidase [Bacteroidales bacterium]
MNRVKLLSLLLTGLLLASCDKCHPPCGKYEHNLLIYMAADNSLSDLARSNMTEIIAGSSIPRDHALLVFIDRKEQGAFLIRPYTRDNNIFLDTLNSYGIVDSANPDLLKQVIGQARDECPAQSYGLILWSHGTGWLPKGLYGETPRYAIQRLTTVSPFLYDIYDPMYPRTKTFAEDGNSQMEIPSLATALADFHHVYICFDACLMADIQTYYQMRNTCDYIMGSPAEIIDTGFPYDKLTSVMFPYRGLSNLTALCDAFYDKYNAKTGYNRSGTISLVKTEYITELALSFKNLISDGGVDPADIDRQGLQTYDRLSEHVFWDIDQMAGLIGNSVRYGEFKTALNKTVIYKKATEKFITIPIEHFSGLAAYLPTTALPGTQSAFRLTSWNQYIGWLTD